MGADVMGGGVVWALAAALWVVYLIPTWLRRRRFMATERNAVRLQQTLRILAETTEVPEQVRVEATAREVAAQNRILRVSESQKRAEEKAQAMELARAEKAARDALRSATATMKRQARSSRGMLRMRQLGALAALLGLVIGVAGLIALGFGGSGLVPGIAGAVFVLGLGTLIVLAPGRHRSAQTVSEVPGSVVRERRPAEVFEPDSEAVQSVVEAATAEEERPEWTPRPLPRPLYLSRGTVAASAMASMDAVEGLRAAAVEAESAQRAAAAVESADVAPLRPVRLAKPPSPDGSRGQIALPPRAPTNARPSSSPSPSPASSAPAPTGRPSRFSSMGVVDGVDTIDLDEALQRRRGA